MVKLILVESPRKLGNLISLTLETGIKLAEQKSPWIRNQLRKRCRHSDGAAYRQRKSKQHTRYASSQSHPSPSDWRYVFGDQARRERHYAGQARTPKQRSLPTRKRPCRSLCVRRQGKKWRFTRIVHLNSPARRAGTPGTRHIFHQSSHVGDPHRGTRWPSASLAVIDCRAQTARPSTPLTPALAMKPDGSAGRRPIAATSAPILFISDIRGFDRDPPPPRP